MQNSLYNKNNQDIQQRVVTKRKLFSAKTVILILIILILLPLIFKGFKTNFSLVTINLDKTDEDLPETGKEIEDIWVDITGDTMIGELKFLDADINLSDNSIVTAQEQIAGEELDILEDGVDFDELSGELDDDQISDGAVDLDSDEVEGVLPISKGGTNTNIFTQGDFIVYDGSRLEGSGFNESSFLSSDTDNWVNTSGDTMSGDLIITTGNDLILGTTALSESTSPTDSGAYIIGTFDEFDNSDSSNVQDVLDDLDTVISSIGSGGVLPDSLDYTEFSDSMSLDGNTSVNFGASNYTYNLNNTGDFNIQDNGVTHWQFSSNGNLYATSDAILNMGGNRIENLGNPNSADDALSLGYADSRYLTSFTEVDPIWTAAEPNYANLSQNEVILGNWDNTTNPWADNEVANNLTISGGSVSSDSFSAYTDLNAEGYVPPASSTIWTDTNDGLGSTLDADTIDSLESADFLRSNLGDNYTSGTLTFDAGTTADFNGDLVVSDQTVIFDSGSFSALDLTGDLRVLATGDDDDYIYFNTATDNAAIFWEGYSATNDPGIRVNTSTDELEYRDEDTAGWTTFDSMAEGAALWTDEGTTLTPTGDDDIRLEDGDWIGVGSGANQPYITFDDTSDYFEFMGGSVGIGTTAPTGTLDVYPGSSNVTFFAGSTSGQNPYFYIYGYDIGASTTRYARFSIGTAGQLLIEAESKIGFTNNGATRAWLDGAYFRLQDQQYWTTGSNNDAVSSYDETNNDSWGFGIPTSNRMFIMEKADVNTATDLSTLGTYSNVNTGWVDADLDSILQVGYQNDDIAEIWSNGDLILQGTSGDVGIGVTTPGELLDVAYNISLGSGSNADNDYLYFDQEGEYLLWDDTADSRFEFSDDVWAESFSSGSTVTLHDDYIRDTGDLNFQPDNDTDDYITLSTGTEVGADTVSAIYWQGIETYTNDPGLSINDDGELVYRDEDASGWTTLDSIAEGAALWSDEGTTLTPTGDEDIRLEDGDWIGVGSGANQPYLTFDDTNAYFEFMEGSVGIGTTAPGQELEVSGDIWASRSNFIIDTPDVGGWARGLHFYATGSSSGTELAAFGILGGGTTVSRLYIAHGDNPWDSTAGIYINTSGDVGIGITNPGEKLHTIGDVRLQSDSDVSNSTISGVLQVQNAAATAAVVLDSDEIQSVGGTLNINNEAAQPISIMGGQVFIQTDGDVGIGTTTPDTNLEIMGSLANYANNVRYYHNVSHYSSVSTSTGTLKIAMPKSWSNTMMQVRIQGYEYQSNIGAWEVIISGYNYSTTNTWTHPTAEIRGTAPFNQVRLAHDGTYNVILLGTTSTSWDYPKVTVSEFIAGHNNITGWGSGWSTSIISSETGITNIVTPTLHFYMDSAGNVGIGTTTVNETLDVQGDIELNLSGTGTGWALCHDSQTGTTDQEIVDCTSPPSADYAEQYAVEPGIDYGDILTVSDNYVTTTSGDRLSKLVKETKQYSNDVIGIVSDNYADFTSAGYNIREEDNPMPISLVGRVPTKVSLINGNINVGDPITTSSIPGVGMKAIKPGTIIGKALEPFSGTNPNSIKDILVFVNLSWYEPQNYLEKLNHIISDYDKGLLNNGRIDMINNLSITDTLNVNDGIFSTIQVDSMTVTNDLTIKGLLTSQEIQTGILRSYNSENIVIQLSESLGETALEIQNGLGNTIFSVDSTGKLTIREDENSPSIGQGVIERSEIEVQIDTEKVTENSRIFITPTVETDKQLSVVEKAENKYFIVRITEPAEIDISFDWWLVN